MENGIEGVADRESNGVERKGRRRASENSEREGGREGEIDAERVK